MCALQYSLRRMFFVCRPIIRDNIILLYRVRVVETRDWRQRTKKRELQIDENPFQRRDYNNNNNNNNNIQCFLRIHFDSVYILYSFVKKVK